METGEIQIQKEKDKEQEVKVEFHGKYEPEAQERFRRAQEEDLNRICDYLQTDPEDVGGISFQVFDNRDEKQTADPLHSPSRASARFNEMTVYQVWQTENDPHFPHETTHLVAHKWSKPYQFTTELDTADGGQTTKTIEMVSTSFMQEGLAMAVDEIVFNREQPQQGAEGYADDLCRQKMDQMPTSLAECVNMEGFCSQKNEVIMPFTASFSKYLLQEYGVERYREMYTQLKETNSPEVNVRAIESVYGVAEDELMQAWRSHITQAV